jgi:hypothetical protein
MKIGGAPHICRFESYNVSSLYDYKQNHKGQQKKLIF